MNKEHAIKAIKWAVNMDAIRDAVMVSINNKWLPEADMGVQQVLALAYVLGYHKDAVTDRTWAINALNRETGRLVRMLEGKL